MHILYVFLRSSILPPVLHADRKNVSRQITESFSLAEQNDSYRPCLHEAQNVSKK